MDRLQDHVLLARVVAAISFAAAAIGILLAAILDLSTQRSAISRGDTYAQQLLVGDLIALAFGMAALVAAGLLWRWRGARWLAFPAIALTSGALVHAAALGDAGAFWEGIIFLVTPFGLGLAFLPALGATILVLGVTAGLIAIIP